MWDKFGKWQTKNSRKSQNRNPERDNPRFFDEDESEYGYSFRDYDLEDEYTDDSLGDFSRGEALTWDFELSASSSVEGRFDLKKRMPEKGYRVMGAAPKAASSGGQHTLATQRRPQPVSRSANARQAAYPSASRQNRYNSSVTMVNADAPAPWETQQASYVKMPIVGEVAAGHYDVTVAYHEPGYGVDADFVMLDADTVKVGRNSFALRVRGQSMIDNEIEHGDIIIVSAQNWADDGDFVIACLTDNTDPAGFVTLKRFYRHKHSDRVVLQPANQQLSPIHILPRKGDQRSEDLDGVKIQGRVTAIIKSS